MRIELPEKVNEIITKLTEQGFEAYAVGGCVRDSILFKIPQDWDITTSASPFEVKQIFKRTIDTGIKHGTVTVMFDKVGFEVTTYRIDGEYEDNRHPKQVEFTKSLTEDLKRRDFTINAMAYNDMDGLVDLFGGLHDIERHIIRCVGSAKERFNEDALRMLRAVRFAAQLDFDIDRLTLEAIHAGSARLRDISAERVRVELSKLLLSKQPMRLLIAYETGITKVILPEFDVLMQTKQENAHHIYTVGIHSLHAVGWLMQECKQIGRLEKKIQLCLCLAALLHDVAKPDTKFMDKEGVAHFHGHAEKGAIKTKEILRRLKFDNETVNIVERLIYYHDYRYDQMRFGCSPGEQCSPTGLRYAANLIGEDIMELLFLLQEADIISQNPLGMESKLEQLTEAKCIYQEIIRNGECISLKTLAVDGKCLIEMGFAPGKELGEQLQALLMHVLKHPEDNKKECLLSLIKK